jgi:alpha-tubulin suppressor-like RCC1 family protein
MFIPCRRPSHVRLVPLAAGGLLALGCGAESEPPTGPGAPSTAVTATATLVFRQISAGFNHSCGVTTDNRAYCWGSDSAGQLGNGATTDRGQPTLVSGGLRFLEVYAGGGHSCGITTANKAYCWGDNGSGQLGDGTTAERHQPVAVANGSFVQIRAGYRHTCAVNASNVAFCWGDNTWGQLGDNSKTRRLKPVRVAGGLTFLRLTTGAMHSCGIGTDRHGYCWGHNGHGELGDGSVSTRLKPAAVMGGRNWRQIWAGTALLPKFTQTHTCGITTDKHAFCWGDNTYGQLGVGTIPRSLVPVAVSGGLTFSSITAGEIHSCATTTSDLWSTRAHAYCWGNGANGQLGNGASSGSGSSPTPFPVSGGLPLTWVAAGSIHTCALTGAGQAYCWGADGEGQLGNGGANTSSPIPVAVVGP